MARNKPRLQLALYARPKHPESYHYALFISPKNNLLSATKHHVKNTFQTTSSGEVTQPWRYERLTVPDVMQEQRLLVRVIIGKVVTSTDGLEGILEALPVYQVDEIGVGGDGKEIVKEFSCRTWVRDAVEELVQQGAIIGMGTWDEMREKAEDYVRRKKARGRWEVGWEGKPGIPMLDLSSGEEVVA